MSERSDRERAAFERERSDASAAFERIGYGHEAVILLQAIWLESVLAKIENLLSGGAVHQAKTLSQVVCFKVHVHSMHHIPNAVLKTQSFSFRRRIGHETQQLAQGQVHQEMYS